MKTIYTILFSIIVLVSMSACSILSPPKGTKERPYSRDDFINKAQVIKEINEDVEAFSSEKELSDLDPEYKERLDSLIPDEIFLAEMEDLVPDTEEQDGDTNIPDHADLTSYVTRVKDQNNGYCTAFATAGAMEATLCKQTKLCNEDLSEQHLFGTYNKYSTRRAVEASSKYWIADEKYWPKYGEKSRQIEQFAHARTSRFRYLGNDHDALMRALSRGNFVVVAMRTPKDMLSCRKTIRTSTSHSSGGHAILAVGYQKTDLVKGGMYVKIKNSWGSDCGDSGFQYVPFKGICNKSNAYCYYWEIEEVVSTKNTLCKKGIK